MMFLLFIKIITVLETANYLSHVQIREQVDMNLTQ